MYFLKIGETILPTPTSYSVNSDDINSGDSCRSDETGIMHRRRIRGGVKTCDVKWRLDGNDIASVQEKLSAPVLSVTMLNPSTAGYCQCEMYAENLKCIFFQQKNQSPGNSYWELSCRLIEY